MKRLNHIAVYITNYADKAFIVGHITDAKLLHGIIDTEGKKIAVFSAAAIEKLVREEVVHEKILLTGWGNSMLQSMSNGQRKKAMLNYLLAQKPDCLIIDDVYGYLDKETQGLFLQRLTELSGQITVIQLFGKIKDKLPFIEKVFYVEKNRLLQPLPSDTTLNLPETLIPFPAIPEMLLIPDSLIPENDILIQMRDVSVSFGEKQVLEHINFTVRKGEFWQLKGENGSGKTTLISLITADSAKGYGQDITIFGRKKGSGESIWDIRSHIGYFTPTMIELFDRKQSVEEMLISGFNDSIGLYDVPSDRKKEIAAAWINILGNNLSSSNFLQLSAGEKSLVMLARAMVKCPPLLILDEPVAELDDASSKLFITLVKRIAAHKQTAIIYISHSDEPDLHPDKVFQLLGAGTGYSGKVEL